MNFAIVLIIGFIAIAFFVDAFRQKSKRNKESSEAERPERILTADESGPTETGRFRAQQALGGSEASLAASKKSDAEVEAEDQPLPDPFTGEEDGSKDS